MNEVSTKEQIRAELLAEQRQKHNEYNRRWRKQNPEKVKAINKRAYLKRKGAKNNE